MIKSKKLWYVIYHLLILIIICIIIVGYGIYLINQRPLVSVVMPVYNREKLVGRAIDSILEQTYSRFELILIDDGSSDETYTILKQYANKDRRIRLLKNDKNKGLAFSRNRGFLLAKGKYLAVMDSDDFAEPGRLEKSVKFMESHPEIDVLSGRVQDINNHNISDLHFDKEIKRDSFSSDEIAVDLMFHNVIANPTSFIRKSFIVDNHIHFDLTMQSAEDYAFWKSCLLAGGKFARLQNVLVYMGHEDSKRSTNYYNFMLDNSIEIHRQFFSLFFRPTQEELKFSYTLDEKCAILKKMVDHPSKIIDQNYIINAYKRNCPDDLESSLYLKHELWNDFLIPEKEPNRYKRKNVNDYATIEKAKDGIIVKWDKYPPEKFTCNEKRCTHVK